LHAESPTDEQMQTLQWACRSWSPCDCSRRVLQTIRREQPRAEIARGLVRSLADCAVSRSAVGEIAGQPSNNATAIRGSRRVRRRAPGGLGSVRIALQAQVAGRALHGSRRSRWSPLTHPTSWSGGAEAELSRARCYSLS
jgi:hypothetical protein